MGLYINPTDGSTKEQWLAKYGKHATMIEALAWDYSRDDALPVILVDNGLFTAAWVTHARDPAVRAIRPNERRPMTVFLVPKEYLKNKSSGIGTDEL